MFSNYEIRTNIASWDEKWVSGPTYHPVLHANAVALKALHHPSFRKSPEAEKGSSWERG